MPEFLIETYLPREARDIATLRAGDAAEQLSEQGAPIHFLCAIFVPEEETCFYLYQAPSAGAVRAAMSRAGLQPGRITPAVAVRPLPIRPGPAAGTGIITGPAGQPPPA